MEFPCKTEEEGFEFSAARKMVREPINRACLTTAPSIGGFTGDDSDKLLIIFEQVCLRAFMHVFRKTFKGLTSNWSVNSNTSNKSQFNLNFTAFFILSAVPLERNTRAKRTSKNEY